MLIALTAVPVNGQGLSGNDLSRVKASDVSDAQLTTIIERGEKEGLSPQQALEMARARGMSASVANELLQRAEQLMARQKAENAAVSALRTNGEPLAPLQASAPEDSIPTLPEEEEEEGPQIFGKSLFAKKHQGFEPAMNVPTPVNYVLGPGDELVVDIWGATTNLHQLTVSTEGTVGIDNLGPIYVQGLTMQQAEERILSKLKQLYRGLEPGNSNATTFARISLGRVRSIQVTVIGEVEVPGSYTVSSLATVFNVLYQAGGPNEIGSFRQIEVLRNNQLVATLDIYELLLKGQQSGNIRLQDQDVVRIATIAGRVEVSGQVRRPGLYEITPGETLAQIIAASGSFTDTAYTRQARIKRNTPSERKMLTVDRDAFNDFEMQNGDQVEIDRLLDRFNNRVSIEGAVWRPGDYELQEGMKLSDLLAKAEGLKPDVFRGRGVINRLTEHFDFEVLSFNVDRVVRGEEDHLLMPEDLVVIRSIHEMREERTVSLGGEIMESGIYQYRQGMTLEDLILMAKGFKASASEARIEINRRIIGEPAPQQRGKQMAETYVFGVERNLTMRPEAESFELKPFDQVYVRPRPDYTVQQSVRIEGEVLFPGDYTLSNRNERISDLVRRAGGLTEEAYIKGATIVRKTGELERVETELQLSIDEIVEDKKKTENYIGIDMARIIEQPGGEDDIFLRPGDVLRVPAELQTVKVSGGVLRETEIRYTNGKNLKYYVKRSGGFAQNARRAKAYVVYANGDVDSKSRFLFFASNPEIEPGAEIVIPQKVEREPMSPGERISIFSSVVSMAAVVITAMSRF